MGRKVMFACLSLCFVLCLLASDGYARAGGDPCYLVGGATHGSTSVPRMIDFPSCCHMPEWMKLDLSDGQMKQLKSLQKQEAAQMQVALKAPDPKQRLALLRKIDVDFRPKVLALMDPAQKRRVSAVFVKMDKLRQKLGDGQAKLDALCKKYGLKSILLYTPKGTPMKRKWNVIGADIMGFGPGGILLREHILLAKFVQDPSVKLSPEQKRGLAAMQASLLAELKRVEKKQPPKPKERKLRRRWYRKIVQEQERIIRKHVADMCKILPALQKQQAEELVKLVEEVGGGAGGYYNGVEEEFVSDTGPDIY